VELVQTDRQVVAQLLLDCDDYSVVVVVVVVVVVEAIESLEPRDEIQTRWMVETVVVVVAAAVVAAAVECESAGQDEQIPVQFAVFVPCWPENTNS
jgi:hypothetical protein